MRFGWKDWHIMKTVKGNKRPLKYMAGCLRGIIKYENTNTNKIPKKPHATPPKQTVTPVLEKMTTEGRMFDKKHMEKEGDMRKAVVILRREMQTRSEENSIYHLQQEFWSPKIDELKERRIDIH